MKKLYTGLLAGILIVIIVAAAWYVWFYKPAAPTQNKIGLILGTGGLGDKSFNDIAFAGCERAEGELGIVFDYAEPIAISQAVVTFSIFIIIAPCIALVCCLHLPYPLMITLRSSGSEVNSTALTYSVPISRATITSASLRVFLKRSHNPINIALKS